MRRRELGGDRGERKREQIGEVEKEGRKGIERIWRGEVKSLGRVNFEVAVWPAFAWPLVRSTGGGRVRC